jgi:hypothetical protein
MTTEKRQWTFMVYMAGDNGKIRRPDDRPLMAPMEGAGLRDIREMQNVGSTDQVAILAQFDTLAENATYRLYIGPGGSTDEQALPEQNTGDPNSLRDFIVWGMTACPAEHFAVVLWNHGTGWKEDDIYAFAKQKQMRIAAEQGEVNGALSRSLSDDISRSRLGGGLFLSSAAQVIGIEEPMSRGICYDDGSMDFLDNAELKRALAEAQALAGKQIDLLGMDACLMSMFEVAYQVKDQATYLVGSQEVEPMAGWPYDRVLGELVKNPAMSTADLAKLIVQAYGESLVGGSRGTGQGITQSAIDLGALEPVAASLKNLATQLKRSLEAGDPLMDGAFFRAGSGVVRFSDKDYADLKDYVSLIKRWYAGADQGVLDAVDHTLAALSDAERPVVLANFAGGPAPYERSTGLSIYVPQMNRYSAYYDKLDCASTGWNDFICTLNQVPPDKRFKV